MYTMTYTQTKPPLIIPDVPMTAADRIELEECEHTIQAGIGAFIEVGTALGIIRDNRLYREQYPTFEAYTRERWQLESRQLAAQKILAAQVANRLSKFFDTQGLRMSHALALADLPDDALQTVYEVVKKTAPGGKITAGHIKSVVTVFNEITATGALDNGDGESIPAGGAFGAAITEETYERVMRQREHLSAKRGKRLAVDTVTVARQYTQDDGCYVVFKVAPETLAALGIGEVVKLVVYSVEVEA